MPQTSPGYRGDHSIVCHGDAFAEELCYDQSTQLELSADDYLWDGEYDFSYHENEVEVDFGDIIWEDSGFDDAAKEIEGESCCYDAEVETCFDAEEEIGYLDAEVEDCYYLCDEDCYDY